MWPTLLLGPLVASLAGRGITAYLQTRRIRRLERSHEEIQVEETLVFDFLHALGEAPDSAKSRGSACGSVSVRVSTLGYGERLLVVLAVANVPMSAPFSQADFLVCKSIAAQSAFALYNAITYSMANEKKRLDH